MCYRGKALATQKNNRDISTPSWEAVSQVTAENSSRLSYIPATTPRLQSVASCSKGDGDSISLKGWVQGRQGSQ